MPHVTWWCNKLAGDPLPCALYIVAQQHFRISIVTRYFRRGGVFWKKRIWEAPLYLLLDHHVTQKTWFYQNFPSSHFHKSRLGWVRAPSLSSALCLRLHEGPLCRSCPCRGFRFPDWFCPFFNLTAFIMKLNWNILNYFEVELKAIELKGRGRPGVKISGYFHQCDRKVGENKGAWRGEIMRWRRPTLIWRWWSAARWSLWTNTPLVHLQLHLSVLPSRAQQIWLDWTRFLVSHKEKTVQICCSP